MVNPTLNHMLYDAKRVYDRTLSQAKSLYDKGSREAILDFLQKNDPNGAYTDRASIADGLDCLTYDEALIELEKVINELLPHQGGLS